MPTRRPVNGPGPIPTATPESAAIGTSDWARQSAMSVPITSACERVPVSLREAMVPRSRSTTATLVPAEVSMARSTPPV